VAARLIVKIGASEGVGELDTGGVQIIKRGERSEKQSPPRGSQGGYPDSSFVRGKRRKEEESKEES